MLHRFVDIVITVVSSLVRRTGLFTLGTVAHHVVVHDDIITGIFPLRSRGWLDWLLCFSMGHAKSNGMVPTTRTTRLGLEGKGTVLFLDLGAVDTPCHGTSHWNGRVFAQNEK